MVKPLDGPFQLIHCDHLADANSTEELIRVLVVFLDALLAQVLHHLVQPNEQLGAHFKRRGLVGDDEALFRRDPVRNQNVAGSSDGLDVRFVDL